MTYTTLEISRSSFNDIKRRLEKAGVTRDYLTTDRSDGEMILFGGIGLVIDPKPEKGNRWCCTFHEFGASLDLECGEDKGL